MSIIAFTDWAIETAIAVTLLTGFVLLIRRPFARRFGAGATYTLWLLPLARLFMPEITLPILTPDPVNISVVTNGIWSGPTSPNIPLSTSETGPGIALIAITIWAIIGVAWLASVLVRQHLYMRNLRKESRPISGPIALMSEKAMVATGLKSLPEIRVSNTQSGPLVTGLFRPLVILPHDFENHFHPQQQYFALLHELTHIKRRDLWAAFGALLFRTINWPNPLIHYAARRFRADQEAACDASVLRLSDAGQNTRAYAETLLQAAKSVTRPEFNAPLGLTIYHPLKERLMMMKNPTRSSLMSRIATSALIVGTAALAAPVTLAAGQDKAEMAGKADTKRVSKQVIKSVNVVDGKKVKTHYEIIEDENGTRAYSIAENGARTEVDPDSIEIKGEMKMIHMGNGAHASFDHDVVILKDGDGQNIKKKIRIVTKDGQMTSEDIEELISEHGDGKHVVIKKMMDGEHAGDKEVKVYNFSSENDFEMDFDGDGYDMDSGVHTKAMVSAASGLLDGVNEDELSDKTRRKIEKARKALKEAEKALENEK